MKHQYLNIGGHLMSLEMPKIMGILNVTPDSFFSGSRCIGKEEIKQSVCRMIDEGVDIIDVGGCSTRPGAVMISPDEEYERILPALEIIRETNSEIPVSVDTCSSFVARKSVEQWNVNIINDISGGELDQDLWQTVADLRVAYVLTHFRGNSENLHANAVYSDVTAEVITELSKKIASLHLLGVNDVIVDPGFGFSKNTKDNFILFQELHELARMGYPLMVGVSRKSMICKTLDCNPDSEAALRGTIALEMIALEKGADIIRTHDVKATKELLKLWRCLKDD